MTSVTVAAATSTSRFVTAVNAAFVAPRRFHLFITVSISIVTAIAITAAVTALAVSFAVSA